MIDNAARPRRLRQSRRARRGAAAVEFALTAPILIMFLFAMLEFGRYNMIVQTASNAAFEGARKTIVPGAVAADAQTAGRSILTAAYVSGGTVTVTPSPIVNTTAQVTVTVNVPITSNMWFTPMFVTRTSVQRSCTATRDWVNSTRSGQ